MAFWKLQNYRERKQMPGHGDRKRDWAQRSMKELLSWGKYLILILITQLHAFPQNFTVWCFGFVCFFRYYTTDVPLSFQMTLHSYLSPRRLTCIQVSLPSGLPSQVGQRKERELARFRWFYSSSAFLVRPFNRRILLLLRWLLNMAQIIPRPSENGC